ncbi:MAG: hypothetical protein JSW07_06380 [bacterium]|nr:MAG: hypothetical protein JSW07_06380 [bacterium]
MEFEPDYHHIIKAASNIRPSRLPLYEHQIDTSLMTMILGEDIQSSSNNKKDLYYSYGRQCEFWKEMTYDTISFEVQICPILPDHGAIYGGRPGPIQNREDFEKYPFQEIPKIFWNHWTPHLEALAEVMPNGMKAVGGCGYGVFEINVNLVGYEPLCLLMYDDPELFSDLYVRIGDLMTTLWSQLLKRYSSLFAVCRMGDDLGYKKSTLLDPITIIEHIIPQYRRIVSLVHKVGKPFLFHSCGNIFSIMDEVIKAGIDAKHSNEDIIAPFNKWIESYGDRIALFGGIDVNILCTEDPKAVFKEVVNRGREYRKLSKGYAIGSGNSNPDYVPIEGYLAMIDGVKGIRRSE